MKEDRRETLPSFQLRPFVTEPIIDKLSISCTLIRIPDTVLVKYNIHGMLKSIKLPSAHHSYKRCHELWRHTCFELFFGIKDDPGYWEVNCCLSGRWNVYRFDDYRLGMREEHYTGRPLCKVTETTDHLSLSCSLNVNDILDDSYEIEAAVCVVIETIDGNLHYLAIEHRESQPDFHNRKSFLINMLAAGD